MPRSNYHASIMMSPGSERLLPPYRDYYPVALCNGSLLNLPIQPLPGGREAIALLMSNQTDFEVEEALGASLSKLAAEFSPEAIAGIPTLGLDYARLVARDLGFTNYVALGNSRKFWYSDERSVAVQSITSPGANKKLYLDPMLVERIAGKRTLIVDDVIHTGGSAAAAIHLLQDAGAIVVGLCVVLIEGAVWQRALAALSPDWPSRVRGIGQIPVLSRSDEGWIPAESGLRE
jgi:adenine/guanine phosphoribosyltransferase-like PRPP-binding protein